MFLLQELWNKDSKYNTYIDNTETNHCVSEGKNGMLVPTIVKMSPLILDYAGFPNIKSFF